MATINTFDDDSARRIAETVRRLERQVRNLEERVTSLVHAETGGNFGRAIRHGKTSTGPDDETYPDEGCTLWVRIQDWGFGEDAGTGACEREETDWETHVLGQVYGGEWLPEDTPVTIVQVHGAKGLQWWIFPSVLEILVGKLAGSLSQNGSATMNEWQRNSGDTGWEVCSPTIERTVHDWLLGSGESISSGKKVIVGRVRRDSKLVVLAAECE